MWSNGHDIDARSQTISQRITGSLDYLLATCAELDVASIPPNLDLCLLYEKILDLSDRVLHLRNASLPVMRLPHEILRAIFQMVQGDVLLEFARGSELEDVHEWMNILSVCRRWHDVALSCAPLWATILIDGHRDTGLYPTTSDAFFQTGMARRFLRRSQRHPLHIGLRGISCFDDNYPEFELNYADFVSKLISILPRTRRLHIFASEMTFDIGYLLLEGNAPSLQTLTLDLYGGTTDELEEPSQFFTSPVYSLRSLRTTAAPELCLASGFRNLRHLRLFGRNFNAVTSFTELLDFLDANSTLKDLTFVECRFARIADLEERRLGMPNLRRLHLSNSGSCEALESLLLHFSLNAEVSISCRDRDMRIIKLQDILSQEMWNIRRLLLTITEHYGEICAFSASSALRLGGLPVGDARYHLDSIRSIANISGAVQDLWIQTRWFSPRARHQRHSDKATLGSEILDGAANIVKLYLCGDDRDEDDQANEVWLAALKGSLSPACSTDSRPPPCPLLRELHLFHPSEFAIAYTKETLEWRTQQGLPPLDKLYVYLPLEGYPEHALFAWRTAFERWESSAPSLLQRFVGELIFIRGDNLPWIELPPVCVGKTDCPWDGPTWDELRPSTRFDPMVFV
ncbi:hypothetical protein NM688_g350 [Phlebia brevispora]|uniref:Uncharacterized protein n=1 Tax=Phlebia brevispora TaxID=194682 RepID=A0ACC1TEL1_9APHY|nr:hypothetical protein NM688_g350 [Phlebia brevispora]